MLGGVAHSESTRTPPVAACPHHVWCQVGDDEEEVRLAQAQVLMDCMADLLSQKGLDGTRAWCDGGIRLRCRSSEQTTRWIVFGQLPEEEGGGMTATVAHYQYDSGTNDCRVAKSASAMTPWKS